jgi:hypothetical protein
VFCVFALLATVFLVAAPIKAQSDDWLAWHGCWRADGAPAGEYLCIVPDDAAGVRMVTVAGSALVVESRVVTDGRPRRVQTEGCSGNEVAFWSADYQRIFLSSDLSCEAGVKRQASGIFAITGEASWISVQAVTIDGRTATRTVSYTAVGDDVAPASIRFALQSNLPERAAARRSALAPVDAEDVNEAVGRIDAAAVQEWLVATGQPFQLAGELMPAADDAVTRSALEHSGSFAQQPTREVVHVVERPVEIVHVVERPVYVTPSYQHGYRYRTCWDPFFSGLVVGLQHGAGIGLGRAHCGRRFLTHFSPWGYDLFGWHFMHVRPIIVAGRPIIRYREPTRHSRLSRTTHGDDDRRGVQPRTPLRPDYRARTATPRDGSSVTSGAQWREGAATPRGYTAGRVLSRDAGSASPRYARPRTPAGASTARVVRSAGSTPSVRSAEPRRSASPPRAPVWAPTTSRAAQPRVSTPARSTAAPDVSARQSRTARQPAATLRAGGRASGRIARTRGDKER